MDGWHVEPREPGPSRGMRVGVASLSLVIVVSLVGVGHTVVTRSQSTAHRASPAPPSTPPQAPLPGAGAWALPPRSWEPLPAPDASSPWAAAQRTALDGVAPVALTGCPAPAAVASEEEWREAVTAQWGCVHAAWTPVLDGLGWPTAEPALEFFTGAGSESDCGYLEAPAFYCSAGEGTVYFGEGHLRMAEIWGLAVNEMVNHEYAHHLQHLAGITDAKISVAPSAEVERRAELQATCWSATMTFHNAAVVFNDETLGSWEERLETMLVDGVHGNRDSIRHWGVRGLYASTLGDCDTWVAPSELVA